MSATGVDPKDPDAVTDYTIDWSAEMTRTADMIAASAWEVESGDVEIDPLHPATFTTTTTTVWLTGGTHGTNSKLVNTITTAGDRVNQRTMTVKVRER